MNIAVCDLCYQLGEQKIAVAWYLDATGKEWEICDECLKIVKKTGLEWTELEPGAEEETG